MVLISHGERNNQKYRVTRKHLVLTSLWPDETASLVGTFPLLDVELRLQSAFTHEKQINILSISATEILILLLLLDKQLPLVS